MSAPENQKPQDAFPEALEKTPPRKPLVEVQIGWSGKIRLPREEQSIEESLAYEGLLAYKTP